MQSGARLFVIVGKLTTENAARLFIRRLASVERLASQESEAFIAKVRQDGVHVWIRFSEWRRT